MADGAGSHEPAPGTAPRKGRRPKFHYELLLCGVKGHALVGTDAARVRPEDHLVVREMAGHRWHRCLRCDSWLALPTPANPARDTPPSREDIVLPPRGRPLRDLVVLRLIAIDRAFHFVVLGLLAGGIFLFASNRGSLRDSFYRIISDLQGGVGGGPIQYSTGRTHGFLHELDKLFTLKAATLHLLGAAVLAYALLEGIEAVGLWRQRRWAEYLTFIATTLFLPLEVYELSQRLSALKIFALILNIAVVVYLLWAKRLFGLNGGAEADEALRERDAGWPALERATPGL